MKYAFIESELAREFPLAVVCRILSVTQAGYHAWLKRPASAMAVARDALAELIKRVFAAFKGKHGAPRIYRELARQHGDTGAVVDNFGGCACSFGHWGSKPTRVANTR